jgi:hypothetical protein
MRRSVRSIVAGVAIAGAALVVVATPAFAWYAAANAYYLYYMPGPPPGTYLNQCALDSSNGTASPDQPYATFYAYKNSSSNCYIAEATVTYDQNGGLYNTPYAAAYANTTAGAFGPNGTGIVAGNFTACTPSFYCLSWSTTPL